MGELGWELHIPTEVCRGESRGERRGGERVGERWRKREGEREGVGRSEGGGKRRRRLSSDILCLPSMLLVCMISWYQWEPSVV